MSPATAARLAELPRQPRGTPWPTQAWPEGDPPASLDRTRLARLVDDAFGAAARGELAETHALLAVHRGRLVLERYAEGYGPERTYPSWSMAKSLTQTLVGLLAADGRIDISAPADVPEWRGAGDPRGEITLDQLLRMSSGLAFTEEYSPDRPADVIEMLWGVGKDDVAAFAAGFPLAHPPGTHWAYSSGTTNIVSRAAARALGSSGPAFEAFMRARLFDPLGMASATPKFDAAGTFVGSSFCFCTARDFARFGLLYLRDGIWDDRRLLPEGWVDYARTPTPQPADTLELGYGAHWWLGLAGEGSFSANGFGGQYLVLVPGTDLILIRHGQTPVETQPAVQAWLAEIAALFRV